MTWHFVVKSSSSMQQSVPKKQLLFCLAVKCQVECVCRSICLLYRAPLEREMGGNDRLRQKRRDPRAKAQKKKKETRKGNTLNTLDSCFFALVFFLLCCVFLVLPKLFWLHTRTRLTFFSFVGLKGVGAHKPTGPSFVQSINQPITTTTMSFSYHTPYTKTSYTQPPFPFPSYTQPPPNTPQPT